MAENASHASAARRSDASGRAQARGGTPAGRALLGGVLALGVSLGVVFARGGARTPHGERAGAHTASGASVSSYEPQELGVGAVTTGGVDASPRVVVDSVFPIEEGLRRFREGLPEVTELSGGASTRDELVDRFLRGIERADTADLLPLLLDRSEFGWLYYPHTMYTAPPYELSPALVWFQMQNLTDSGLVRVFRLAEQGPLHAKGYRCEETPKVEGPNRVWRECLVILRPAGSAPVEVQLFGSILERGGRYKFVSYASSL